MMTSHAPVSVFTALVMTPGPTVSIVRTAYMYLLCCLVVAASMFGVGRGFQAVVGCMIVTEIMHAYGVALRFACKAEAV